MNAQGDSKGDSKESKTPAPARRKRPMSLKKWLALAVVVLVLLYLAVNALVLAPLREAPQFAQGRRDNVQRIIEDLGYFTGARAIPDLHQDVSHLGFDELEKMRELAHSAGKMVEAIHSGDMAKMRTAKTEYETLAAQHPLNCPNILAGFNALAARLGEITQLETELAGATVSGGDFEAFEKLQARGAALGSALGDGVPAEVRVKLERVVHAKLAEGLLALLKGPPAPTRDYRWFETTWGQLKLSPYAAESKAPLDQVQRIAIDWQMVEAQDAEKPSALLQARLKDDTSKRVWPAWLREQAEAKVLAAQNSDIGADEAGPRAIPAEAPRSRVAGGAPATAPLPWTFFLSDDNRFPVELPERGEGFTFFLRTTANADVELPPTGGVLARGLGPNGESFKSYGGRLITGKASPPTPYIFVGKRADGSEAFHIYVGLGRLNKAIFGVVDGGLKREGDKIVVDVSKLPGGVLQPLWLRVPPGFGVKGSTIAFLGVRAGRANLAPVVKEIKNQIQKQSEAAAAPAATPSPAPVGAPATAAPTDAAKPATTPSPAVATPAPSGSGAEKKEATPGTESATAPEAAKPAEPKDPASTTPATPKPADKPKDPENPAPATPKAAEKPKPAANATPPAPGSAARPPEPPKPLAEHPLLHGKLPPGTYTLLVEDGDKKVPLIDFKIP